VRIAFAIPFLSERTLGLQPWSYSYQMASALAQLGCEVTLITTPSGTESHFDPPPSV